MTDSVYGSIDVYFLFAALLYNIWRLTRFLLKVDAGEIEYAPVLTAGECVDPISPALLPPY